jgi:hypothetical protein
MPGTSNNSHDIMHSKSFSVKRRRQPMEEHRPKKLSSGLESFARPVLKQPQGLFTEMAERRMIHYPALISSLLVREFVSTFSGEDQLAPGAECPRVAQGKKLTE